MELRTETVKNHLGTLGQFFRAPWGKRSWPHKKNRWPPCSSGGQRVLRTLSLGCCFSQIDKILLTPKGVMAFFKEKIRELMLA